MTHPFLPFTRPSTNETDIAAVVEVLRSGWITTGPKSQQLEQHFSDTFGCRHAISVCSATGGMHVALLALGIGPGDEVITPSQTWVSTANLITLLGAKPVFVDVDRDTLMMDAAAAETAITPRTRAIIPVHYAGAPADLDPIHVLAARHGLAVIEDAAHANGTRYKDRWIGAQGTAIFSFHAIKNVTSAEGGLIATDDDALAERVRRLKFHGLGADAFDRAQQGRKPQAEVIEPGFKYNLADMNAALALSQMKRLTQINARRRELVALYQQELSGSPLRQLAIPLYPHHHAWHLFMVRIDPTECGIDRDTFMQRMQQHGIGTGLHFRGIHTQKYYRDLYPDVSLPNTEWNTACLCTLPLFPDMTEHDVHRVVRACNDVLNDKESQK